MVAAAVVSIALSPPVTTDGPLLDLIVALRAMATSASTKSTSPVAVIALDRRSLASPELVRYPRDLLGPVWTTTLTAALNAGARIVAFDEIFAYDPATLPGIDPAFDQSFLAALHQNRCRVVLARSVGTLPARPFAFSVGYDALGLSEVPPDPDGRYRHVPAWKQTADGREDSLTNVLLKRAGFAMPKTVLITPRRHLERIPTYALVDVLRCADSSPAALAAAFGGKIVLVGGTLPEEDRKETSGRFLAPALSDSPLLAPCGLRTLGASSAGSDTVPGVFLHAAAAEAVATGDITLTAPTLTVALLASISAGVGAGVALLLAPWTTAALLATLAALLLGAAAFALQLGWWIPIAMPLYSLGAAPVLSWVVRYLVEERTRRRVINAFGHYLSPTIVEELAADPSALKLGGERREITVMFADLSGFTAMSGKVSPEILTATVNRYLSYVVAEVERAAGYVDKFIGDAVMAIWGAPVASPLHASKALRCAMRAAESVARAQREDESRGQAGFSIKIGLNSGPAVVGNVGTEHRYNYTAVGETVNLASRLEGVPGIYHCAIGLGPRTAELVREEFVVKELDWILVKGAHSAMPIYEPIVQRDAATSEQLARVARFAEALTHYRDGNFSTAASIWEELAGANSDSATGHDGHVDSHLSPELVMARRAREFMTNPPIQPWNAVNVLTTK